MFCAGSEWHVARAVSVAVSRSRGAVAVALLRHARGQAAVQTVDGAGQAGVRHDAGVGRVAEPAPQAPADSGGAVAAAGARGAVRDPPMQAVREVVRDAQRKRLVSLSLVFQQILI